MAKERRFLTARVGVAGSDEMGRSASESRGRGGGGGRGGSALNGDESGCCEGATPIDGAICEGEGDGDGDGGAHERGCSAGSADSFR